MNVSVRGDSGAAAVESRSSVGQRSEEGRSAVPGTKTEKHVQPVRAT